MEIISSLRLVDKVYLSIDQDASVSKTIEKIYLENKHININGSIFFIIS